MKSQYEPYDPIAFYLIKRHYHLFTEVEVDVSVNRDRYSRFYSKAIISPVLSKVHDTIKYPSYRDLNLAIFNKDGKETELSHFLRGEYNGSILLDMFSGTPDYMFSDPKILLENKDLIDEEYKRAKENKWLFLSIKHEILQRYKITIVSFIGGVYYVREDLVDACFRQYSGTFKQEKMF